MTSSAIQGSSNMKSEPNPAPIEEGAGSAGGLGCIAGVLAAAIATGGYSLLTGATEMSCKAGAKFGDNIADKFKSAPAQPTPANDDKILPPLATPKCMGETIECLYK